jgi:hypothetical protein
LTDLLVLSPDVPRLGWSPAVVVAVRFPVPLTLANSTVTGA